MLVPRTAPTAGEMIRYDAPFTLQVRVVFAPAEMEGEEAVKLEIAGALPCGTLEFVYTGFI